MTPKTLLILLLALCATAQAQSDDELHIPVENDNQFPPDKAAGVTEELLEATTESPAPVIQDVQLTALIDNVTSAETINDNLCPKDCVCNIEADTNKRVVDCSGLGPKPTELNLQNNESTEMFTEVTEEPLEATNDSPVLDDVQLTKLIDDVTSTETINDNLCPKDCVCNIDADTNKRIVDCSGLDPKPTELNLQNNELTEMFTEVTEELLEATTDSPVLDDVQLTALIDDVTSTETTNDNLCPKDCVCNIDADTNKRIVDCSGLGPKPTELNLQNNELTELFTEVTEELLEATTDSPVLDDVQLTKLIDDVTSTETINDNLCPEDCVCNIDADTNKRIVDCSGLESKTTELNLQNNESTELFTEVTEELLEATTDSPVLDDVQLAASIDNVTSAETTNDNLCPIDCVCNIEVDTNKRTVDCSGSDPKTTELNLQNNKLTEIVAGVTEAPLDQTTELPAPVLADVQLTALIDNVTSAETISDYLCPKPCVCNMEVDTNKYIVNCSGYEITELPKPLDPKTTDLNLQNNKLTEIPKDISALKDLKTLNVNNNEIMEIVSGSISELPELTSLKLGNNRLIQYPEDLKNSFGLTKLEELDLGGNDMRTSLKPETFSNLKGLRSLTLPTAAADLVQDLCASLKESLKTVCTGSCSSKSFECSDAPQGIEEGLLDFALPGLIAFMSAPEDKADPTVNSAPEAILAPTPNNVSAPPAVNVDTTKDPNLANNNNSSPVNEVSLRSTIIKVADEESKPSEVKSANEGTTKSEKEVVGATTINTKTGGVDKSLIGIIVAGMVLVVAGITIKKNWSSIRNRFRSTPRNEYDRTGVNTNGTMPEEVPLQEKSPV